MIIRPAQEADASAMGQVMVSTYLAAHRDQMPDQAWAKRAKEWTPEVSAQGWARTLREIATDERPQDCIYVAVDDDGAIVGLAMGGSATQRSYRRPALSMRSTSPHATRGRDWVVAWCRRSRHIWRSMV